MSTFNGVQHRNAVHDTSVEHWCAIHIHHTSHIRYSRRSHDDIIKALRILIFREIFRPTCLAIRRHHLKLIPGIHVSIPVERHQFIGEIIVKQLTVEDTSLSHQILQPYIAEVSQHVDIGNTCTPDLAAHIRNAITGSCRYRHHIVEVKSMLHKSIKYPRGKHATHATSFEYQTRITVYPHVYRLSSSDLEMSILSSVSFSFVRKRIGLAINL